MKIGDLVKNIMPVHTNPVVHKHSIPRGQLGIVIDIRPDTLNNPPSTGYCDVMLSVNGRPVNCGNYRQTIFEVIK
jgi:hypothetical protein